MRGDVLGSAMTREILVLSALLFAGTAAARAQGRKNRLWERTDYGPFFSYTVEAPVPRARNIANRGITLRLERAAMCFDTDLLRMAVGWSGGFLKLRGRPFDEKWNRRYFTLFPEGKIRFATSPRPGWSRGREFDDPRPKPFGPLPADWARYRGLYRHGRKVVLSYTVGNAKILELAGLESSSVFARTFEVSGFDAEASLLVAEVDKVRGRIVSSTEPSKDGVGEEANQSLSLLAYKDGVTVAGAVGTPRGSRWFATSDGRIYLTIPAMSKPFRFKVLISNRSADVLGAFRDHVRDTSAPVALEPMTKGGPPLWTEPVVTRGTRGRGEGAYVVDTLTLPEDNPWRAWLRPAGIEFLSDGRGVICSYPSGDVWIISGIDESLEKLEWKRYATGLFQPMGLEIVDDVIYVLGRDRITRLHDLDGDGEADFYENFNSGGWVSADPNNDVMGLVRDPEGSFYFFFGGNHDTWVDTKHQGCILKVSKDGKTLGVYATGFRAVNGLGMSPSGLLSSGDNQGYWVPTARLNRIRKGGFYGYVYASHRRDDPPTTFDPPICWIPHSVDNSCGGQVWVTSDRWGPLQGRMLHTSYGKCALFLVLTQTQGDRMQGGVVRFPLDFRSGIMRGSFRAKDGQLYVTGLKGNVTTAVKDGSIHRVRYTGKRVLLPSGIRVVKDGIHLSFHVALDPDTAGDAENYSTEQWNYRWTKKYGSEEYSVVNPRRRGHDALEVRNARLANDGKSVFLKIPALTPSMQTMVRYRMRSATGARLSNEIYLTVHFQEPD